MRVTEEVKRYIRGKIIHNIFSDKDFIELEKKYEKERKEFFSDCKKYLIEVDKEIKIIAAKYNYSFKDYYGTMEGSVRLNDFYFASEIEEQYSQKKQELWSITEKKIEDTIVLLQLGSYTKEDLDRMLQ